MPRVRSTFALVVALAARGEAGGLGVELQAGYLDLTNARDSAAAVFGGAAGGVAAGVAFRADVGASYFARAGVTYFERDGERVFVPDDRSEVFRLGHPLEVRLVPAYVDVCRRLRREAALRPYIGAGLGMVLLRERSTVAGEILTQERRRPSARLILGFAVGRGPLQIGAEVAYARTPDAIGLGGVSKAYGERDIGGVSAAAVLSWQP